MKLMVALDGSDHALVGLELASILPLGPGDDVVLVAVAEEGPVPARRLRRQHRRHLALLLQAAWAARRAEAQATIDRGPAACSAPTAPPTTAAHATLARRSCS